MWDLFAAALVLTAHLLFIGFVVGGSFLAWRWPRLIWVQLPAMVYGVLVELVGFSCPLTALQNYHRPGTPRPGSSLSAPRCRSTAAAPRPTGCPS
jgi:Protein of Unknown function (DUF2784)